MGISRTDPNGKPTYRRRCADCVFVIEGERISEILKAQHTHMHQSWIREDRSRDPMEGVTTQSMSAVGDIHNVAEPRDKDKPYHLRVVKDG